MELRKKIKNFFTLTRKANAGFTLVELIVVIAILAILGGVAVPAYSGYVKKAERSADEALLNEINTAFASACMANGESNIGREDKPTIKIGAAGSEGLTVAIDALTTSNAGINESFKKFFEGGTFKVVEVVYYSDISGVFKEGTKAFADAYNTIMNDPATAAKLAAVNASKFAEIGASSLLQQVDGVSGIAAAMIGAGQGKMYEAVMNEDYRNSLAAKMGITRDELDQKMEDMAANDPEGFCQFMANSTVLNVAGTMNDPTKFDETATKNMFANANWGGLGTTLNENPETGLAQAAMLYGMYTAFDPEGAKSLDSTADLILLSQNTEFKAYLAEINTDGSQAQKDYAGYKAALDIVNSASSSADVTNQILNKGYGDDELSALLQQAMNQK